MINLLFTGNDKIFDGLSIALVSIVKHCKQPLNVDVLTMDLQEINPNYKPITEKYINLYQQGSLIWIKAISPTFSLPE